MKYERVERMLRKDFEEAKANHNFCEMTDDYELLRELWATGELDSEEYHGILEPIVHCFVEVKDNKIELPLLYKSCKQNIGKKVIYSLEEEGKETKYILLENFVELNVLAIKTLRLCNGDVVELCIDNEMITILPQ